MVLNKYTAARTFFSFARSLYSNQVNSSQQAVYFKKENDLFILFYYFFCEPPYKSTFKKQVQRRVEQSFSTYNTVLRFNH